MGHHGDRGGEGISSDFISTGLSHKRSEQDEMRCSRSSWQEITKPVIFGQVDNTASPSKTFRLLMSSPASSPIYRPLSQNTYQNSLYLVLHRLAMKRRQTEVRHKILPILYLTARDGRGLMCLAGAGRCSRAATVGRASPWSEAPAWGEAVHQQRRWLLQGSLPPSGTGSGGGGEYLRNGTSELLKEGAA